MLQVVSFFRIAYEHIRCLVSFPYVKDKDERTEEEED